MTRLCAFDAEVTLTFCLKSMKAVDDNFPAKELANNMIRLTKGATSWKSDDVVREFTVTDAAVRNGMIVITLNAEGAVEPDAGSAFEKRMEDLSRAALPFSEVEIMVAETKIVLSKNTVRFALPL